MVEQTPSAKNKTEPIDDKPLWLYVKLPDTYGWRLAINIPLRDVAICQAMVNLLKTQYDTPRQWSFREEGKKHFRELK